MIVEPEVVGEFASGSHEAFHKIFKLFYPKVYAFIRGFIKDLDDSEDLTQIVFIKLWNKRAIFHKVHHFMGHRTKRILRIERKEYQTY